MRRELDYTGEARNALRFAENLANEEGILIPKIFWSHTTSQVLTMEYVHGTKVSQIAVLKAKGIDLNQVARRGATSFMKQVMVYGFFHGDPHPGNILIKDDGTIAFIDFGSVGRIDKISMGHLVDLFVNITKQDIPGIIRSLRAIAPFGGKWT